MRLGFGPQGWDLGPFQAVELISDLRGLISGLGGLI